MNSTVYCDENNAILKENVELLSENGLDTLLNVCRKVENFQVDNSYFTFNRCGRLQMYLRKNLFQLSSAS